MDHDVLQCDFLTLMAALEDNSIDLIVTDPPYSSLEKHRSVGTTTRLKKEWFPVVENSRLDDFLREAQRVLRKNSHCYIFCDYETQDYLKDACARVAPKLKWWDPIVWDKKSPGMGYHYRRRHEFICFLELGKRKLHNLGEPSVLESKRVVKGYPTEKPVDVLERLIRNSAEPGCLVLDPFCGSGSTGEAALRLGCKFLGGDVVEKAVRLTEERLRRVEN